MLPPHQTHPSATTAAGLAREAEASLAARRDAVGADLEAGHLRRGGERTALGGRVVGAGDLRSRHRRLRDRTAGVVDRSTCVVEEERVHASVRTGVVTAVVVALGGIDDGVVAVRLLHHAVVHQLVGLVHATAGQADCERYGGQGRQHGLLASVHAVPF